MKCTELSLNNLENSSREWAVQIKKEFQPDLIVYVAKAGYVIGREMAYTFDVPLIGIAAERKGSGVKSKFGKLVKLFPNFVRDLAIYIEVKSNVHEKNTERHVEWIDDPILYVTKVHSILVVDDSVDTGYSIECVKKTVKQAFENADIRVAGLNVWDKSENRVHTDYFLYRNTIIKAPMSKDSKEYEKFVEIYKNRI